MATSRTRTASSTGPKADEEVHRFVSDLRAPLGTHLYGRRLYEVMSAWETMDTVPGAPPYTVDFARIWQAAEKIVYSGTLEKASTANTRIEREFQPEAVHRIKDNAATDLLVGGCSLAAVALKAVLVDEVHLFVVPMVVGGGKGRSPTDSARSSNCSTSTASATERCSFATARSSPGSRTTTTPGRQSLDSLSPIGQAHPVGPMRARRPVRPRQSRRPVPTHPPTRPNGWIPPR